MEIIDGIETNLNVGEMKYFDVMRRSLENHLRWFTEYNPCLSEPDKSSILTGSSYIQKEKIKQWKILKMVTAKEFPHYTFATVEFRGHDDKYCGKINFYQSHVIDVSLWGAMK